MRWPKKFRGADEQRERQQDAAHEWAQAVERRRRAEEQASEVDERAREAQAVARVARNDLERNGFTELLQQAWGGAAT